MTKKKAPSSFPLFPSDLLVGTALMSNEEFGIYVRLLCYQWEFFELPNDMTALCKLAGNAPVPTIVLAKFEVSEDKKSLRNRRMEIERAKLGVTVSHGMSPQNTVPIPDALKGDGFPEAWADYEGYRIEINQPLTSYTRRQLFLKCERLGAKKAVAMIRETIAKSHKNLYEPHELTSFNGKPQEIKETLTQRWQRDNPRHLTFSEWRAENNC